MYIKALSHIKTAHLIVHYRKIPPHSDVFLKRFIFIVERRTMRNKIHTVANFIALLAVTLNEIENKSLSATSHSLLFSDY